MTRSYHRLLLPLLLMVATLLHGDLFWRLPRNVDTSIRLSGGTQLYQSSVEVNGAAGKLTAFAFDRDARAAATALARSMNITAPAYSRGYLLTHVERNTLRRFFILPSATSADSSMALLFEQPLSDAAAARTTPTQWPSPLPHLDATPTFTAYSSTTRTTFATGHTQADPASAVDSAISSLKQDGWIPTDTGTPTFKLCTSGNKICIVMATTDTQSGASQITLLLREGATR